MRTLKPRLFEDYIIYIDQEKCDGCKECIYFCPCDVFEFTTTAHVARPESCLGCRTCEAVCKSEAIIVTEI